MEAKRGTRQGTRSLSENTNTKRTTRAKLPESNATVLHREETTGVEGEDENSEDESDTNQGRARTPSTPVSKQTQNHPNTPIRGYLRNREKQATPRRSLGEDQSSNRINLGNAIQALIDELKTTRAQQETKDKLVADRVAALRTEIAALQADNTVLKKELREVSKELKVLVTSSNTKTYTGAIAGTGEGPEPVYPNQQKTPQFSATQIYQGRQQYQEQTVVILLGKSAAENKGKSTETLKEIAQKELQKEETTKAVQVIAVSTPAQGRLEIITGSKEQAQAARENRRWVQGFGEGAKSKEATWYPVKVDRVDRKTLYKEGGTG